ncbi:MAG: recombination mediator RecR [Pseudomonadota bacterium]
MTDHTVGPEIERLIQLLAKLPGLGPRSARRAALHLIKRKDQLLGPLAEAMVTAYDRVVECENCGNIDTTSPCSICTDPKREAAQLVVVEDVSDLWALERANALKGVYHVLGGVLSPLDGVGPEQLSIDKLIDRASQSSVREVVLAINATVEGQTTAFYLTDRLAPCGVTVTRLAHGVPVGGELDYLDEGTLAAAMRARSPLQAQE